MTLPELHIDDAALRNLGSRMGGCDFSGNAQRSFLTSASSCDVQAAPGSGKTTLLVAKLLHLHDKWGPRRSGVCVLSHTNAARREVERRLGTVALSEMAAHPHFVGTVTTFVHRFLALPYLRGLRWPVNVIDNDRFEAVATRLVTCNSVLARQRRKQNQFQGFAKRLIISDSLSPLQGQPPAQCPIRDIPKLPRAGTNTRTQFERVKGALIKAGIYRYDDLTVLANKALDTCPDLIQHLRHRFALVLLDEAQDTSSEHLDLLDRLFGDQVVQRLGDCNQTLYDSDASWVPRVDAIDLGSSRRFQAPIAEFATRITARRQQTILGHERDELSLPPTLITFPKASPHQALSSFADLVRAELPAGSSSWVVSWVHRPTGSASAVSLQSYAPNYRPPTGPRRSSDTCFDIVSAACHLAGAEGSLAEPVRSIRRALLRLLRRQGVDGLNDVKSAKDFQRWLADADPEVAKSVDALIVETLTTERARFADAAQWERNAERLVEVVGPLFGGRDLKPWTRAFLKLPAAPVPTVPDVLGMQHVDAGPLRLNLGSVASVKGRTHDATMVVQTTSSRVPDVRTALELAVGERRREHLGTTRLRAATNVFVGATRPRHLLCLALPSDDLTPAIKSGIAGWGWRIIDAS